MAKKEESVRNSLNSAETKRWAKNMLLFSSPALLAFLTGLQSGDYRFAFGAGYSALLSALIDLIRKFKEGK